MSRKQDLWEHLDLPGETLPGQVLVEIAGESRVLIEHHQGVSEYSHDQISVKVKYGLVQISGSCLELQRMTKAQLVICGKIEGVVLKRRGKR